MQFSQPSSHSIPLQSKYSPQPLFPNTLSSCFSLNVRDHVSDPYRTRGKIIVLYIINFTFFNSKQEYRGFWTEW
jgi:hypothetical protein